jgi:hypothetical protein
MALTLDGLKTLLEAVQLQYFIAPDKPNVMLHIQGAFGRYQILILLECNGEFVQFRTIGYLNCPPDHRHLSEVLKAIGAMNYIRRLVKFGWDAADGELVAFADLWLMDSTLTLGQFRRMLDNYFGVADEACARLSLIMETGKDPGDLPAEEMMREMLRSGSLPGPARARLEKLLGKVGPREGPDKGPDFSSI